MLKHGEKIRRASETTLSATTVNKGEEAGEPPETLFKKNYENKAGRVPTHSGTHAQLAPTRQNNMF